MTNLTFSSHTTWDMSGLDELIKDCIELESYEIGVGFGSETHPRAEMPMANLAWILETGADLPNGEIPPRQFMESTNFQWEVDNQKFAPPVISRILYKSAPIIQQLKRLGGREKSLMQQVMRLKVFPNPSNAESVIASKGRDDALIDKGTLVKSVRVDVRKKSKIEEE